MFHLMRLLLGVTVGFLWMAQVAHAYYLEENWDDYSKQENGWTASRVVNPHIRSYHNVHGINYQADSTNGYVWAHGRQDFHRLSPQYTTERFDFSEPVYERSNHLSLKTPKFDKDFVSSFINFEAKVTGYHHYKRYAFSGFDNNFNTYIYLNDTRAQGVRRTDLGDGWIRLNIPFHNSNKEGDSLKITLTNGYGTSLERIMFDNFSMSTLRNDHRSVTIDNTEYHIPIGYNNFYGVLNNADNLIKPNKTIAGKALATSQALGELEAFSTELIPALNDAMVTAATAMNLNNLKNGLEIATACAIELSTTGTINATEQFDSLAAAGFEAGKDLYSLFLAATTSSAAKQAAQEVADFQAKLRSNEPLTEEEINAAYASLRKARGYAQATVGIIKTTMHASESFVENLIDSANSIIATQQGGYLSYWSSGFQTLDNLLSFTNAVDAIIAAAESHVHSPYNEVTAPIYQNIAEQRGYTAKPATNYFAGGTPPTWQGAIYMGETDGLSTKFDIPVEMGPDYYLDPEVAVGFEYLVEEGPNFASVTLPFGFGDDSYELWLFDYILNDFYLFDEALGAGDRFEFGPRGTDRFLIKGIEEEAGLSATDHTSFITKVSFVEFGQARVTQTALTTPQQAVATPEPSTFILMLLALLALRYFTPTRFTHLRKQNHTI